MKTEFSTYQASLFPKDTNRHFFLGPLSKVDPKHSWDNPRPWGDMTLLRYRSYVPPPHNLSWISRTKPLRFHFFFFFWCFGSLTLKTRTFKKHTHKKLESLHACTVRGASSNRPEKNLFCLRLTLSTEIAYNNQNYKYEKGDQGTRVGRQWVHLPRRTYQTTTTHRATLAEISVGTSRTAVHNQGCKERPTWSLVGM